MTETQAVYAKRQGILDSPDELTQLQQSAAEAEAARIANLPRDELIYLVDGHCDSQQELTERLAEAALEESKRQDLLTSTDELKQLRQRIATLEAALDKAKQRELTVLGWLQERDAWAKAWKEKAKENRAGWHYCYRNLMTAKGYRFDKETGRWQCPECD